MARSNLHITILTLNVNGINAPVKRHRLANWIESKPISVLYQETHLMCKDTYKLKIRVGGRFTKQIKSKKTKAYNPDL